ncbi:hypothetical protein [Erwinia phyllosphaerae]|uniref:hypothetical protein n=1 Tax=Erwinia phyllosphaerae TaxID=2853256 RepID=UPI001FEDEAE3|nr:hypothetical protein [Erwinia phyllosphaerae]MBV4366918.1 hypothetical protein [Erwinia phyllosphaerae]
MKRLVALAVSCALLSGCLHTTPMPVQISQPGDEIMSCQSIISEMGNMTNEVKESDSDHTKQVATNSILGVTGVFLLIPLFFIDTSDAHSVESNAAKTRLKKLNQIYSDKGCAKSQPLALQVPR